MKRNTAKHTAALLYYALLVTALMSPLLRVFSTAFIGDAFGDAYEYARHIWWMKTAISEGRLPFAQPLLAYPDGLTGAWLWGNPFQSFPAWALAFVMPLPAAYNASFLTHLTLNGFSAYFLGWRLTGHRAAALLCGTVFVLFPNMQAHLIHSHVGLLVLWGVPLYALALWRLRHAPRATDTLLAALALVLCILGNNLLLIYAVLPITAAFALEYLLRRQYGPLARTVSGAFIGGVMALVFVGPVALEQTASPVASIGGDVFYSADLLAAVAPSFYNPLFSDLTYSRTVLGGVQNVESTGYIGVMAAVLMLVAVWRVREARVWGWLALGAWVLSLGPLLKVNGEIVTVSIADLRTYIVLPWAALMNLPVLESVRTPGRFGFAVGLTVAVLAAYGLRAVLAGRGRWLTTVTTGALVVLIAFEYQVMWRGNLPYLHTTPYLAAPPIDAEAEAVFNIPYNHVLTAKDGMILQTQHGKPMIAGHVTRRTPVNPAKLAILQDTFDPALLELAGADTIILHRNWDNENGPGPVEANTLTTLGEPYYIDDRLMAWRAPSASAPPGFVVVPAEDTTTTRGADSYVYAPSAGWATLSGNASDITEMGINGVTVRVIDGDFRVRLPLAGGYHTITLSRPVRCRTVPDPALLCPSITLNDIELTDWTPANTQPITFGDDITLTGYDISPEGVSLAWAIDGPLPENLVRFVHLLDADGTPVLQVDSAPGGTVETISLDTLEAGTYTVYIGWYTLPEVTRLPVGPSSISGAQSGWAQLGEVTVR